MKETLLIADGDAELCDLYEMFLNESGYEVVTASSGLDCLKRLRQLTPDAIMIDRDLRWGGSDGILDWLRHNSSARGIPVIMTAWVTDSQDLAEFIEKPVIACLSKPVATNDLLDNVRSAIASNRRWSPSTMDRVDSNLVAG